jgi:hypothetical protein
MTLLLLFISSFLISFLLHSSSRFSFIFFPVSERLLREVIPPRNLLFLLEGRVFPCGIIFRRVSHVRMMRWYLREECLSSKKETHNKCDWRTGMHWDKWRQVTLSIKELSGAAYFGAWLLTTLVKGYFAFNSKQYNVCHWNSIVKWRKN